MYRNELWKQYNKTLSQEDCNNVQLKSSSHLPWTLSINYQGTYTSVWTFQCSNMLFEICSPTSVGYKLVLKKAVLLLFVKWKLAVSTCHYALITFWLQKESFQLKFTTEHIFMAKIVLIIWVTQEANICQDLAEETKLYEACPLPANVVIIWRSKIFTGTIQGLFYYFIYYNIHI